MFKRKAVLLIISTIILGVCSIISLIFLTGNNHQTSNWGNYPDESIFSASESIVIGNRSYSLDAHLGYDYMPPIDPIRGVNLIVSLYIIPDDDLDFPSNLNPIRVWLKWGGKILSRALPEESYFVSPNKLRKFVNDGQQGLRGFLDVIVQLRYNDTELFYLVKYDVEVLIVW